MTFELHLHLLRIEPMIWRRLLVPASSSLEKLHYMIQTTMGWTHSHLHAFIVDDEYFTLPFCDPWDELGYSDARELRIRDVLRAPGDEIRYHYDFGDSWDHVIRLDSRTPSAQVQAYAQCIGGARACPPEDCGGSSGYQEMLRSLADPRDPEHEGWSIWVGPDFDPERLYLDRINAQLRRPRCGFPDPMRED